MIVDLINLVRALFLIPVGFAGAFTAFPIFDAQMRSEYLRDGLTILVLAAAYVYLVGGLAWLSRFQHERTFLGLVKSGWMVAIVAAYGFGAGIVIVLSVV